MPPCVAGQSRRPSAAPEEEEAEDLEPELKPFVMPPGIGTIIDDAATCTRESPERRIVWVKTHKTGSSTMTNMFHRIAHKYNISLALPTDDMYFQWPRKTEIITSISYPVGAEPQQHTFEMLCSGHIVYNRPEIERVVPDAKYVTIVRNPISHFKSSWSYWGMSKHVDDTGVPFTMEKFLNDSAKYIQLIPENDRRMIHNNIAYDLGLGEDPTINDVDRYIAELSSPTTGFAVVLVGEHLDESLVLLRRKMCWELEDVVHFSLKVSKRPSTPMAPAHVAEIMRFNAVDAALYTHFNESLWREIAAAPALYEEVQVLRALREHMVTECEAVKMSNRKGRLLLMTQPRQSLSSRCARLTMDSIEFSRYFKLAQGVPYGECIRPGTASYLMLVKPRFAGIMGDALTNIINRKAAIRNGAVAVPGDMRDEHTSSYHVYSNDPEEQALWVADGTPLFDSDALSPLIRGGNSRFMTIIPDPVDRFLEAWAAYDMDAALARLGHSSGMAAALTSNRPRILQALEPIRNTFSKDFNSASPNDITKASDTSKMLRGNAFSIALPSTALDEGLVYLSRLICWELSDMVYIRQQLQGAQSQRSKLPAAVVRAIEKFNRVDVRLFQAFERGFRANLQAEYKFDDEVARFRQLVADRVSACIAFEGQLQNDILRVALNTAATPEQHTCAFLHMEPASFSNYFAQVFAHKKRFEVKSSASA